MAGKVVDPSAIGALLFAEPQADHIARQLSTGPLVAPALLWFEVANICLKKLTAHPEKREAILSAYALLNAMRIEPVEVDHQALVEFAEETGLTAYDASYLWLARALSAELITLDRRLSRAAARLPW